MNRSWLPFFWIVLGSVSICADATSDATGGTFHQDAALVQKHVPVIVLSNPGSPSRVLVAPTLQGRVLTSTTGGEEDPSFGWINFKLMASGQVQPHINAFGGEDRIWLGPEGGQFGFYFPPGAPFDFAHWQTPAALDVEPFDVVSQKPDEVTLKKELHLVNYSGTKFDARIVRKVRILKEEDIWNKLQLPAQKGVRAVGFESLNELTNLGDKAWDKSTGLVSIWILGQFNASPQAAVIVPYRQGSESELGPIVESDYFGSVPPDRLKVADGIIYFRTDAHYRSKIGLSPQRALPILGSYDAGHHLLTLVQYAMNKNSHDYVNSQWKQQDHPFAGSVVNSYNDGPNDTGNSLGNFYELESSSPALALAPNKSGDHFQRTIHLYGDPDALKAIARHALGVDLDHVPFN